MRLFLNLEYVIDFSLSRAFRFNKILRVLELGNLFWETEVYIVSKKHLRIYGLSIYLRYNSISYNVD